MLPGLNSVFKKFHEYRSTSQWVGLSYLTAITSGDPPRTVSEGYQVASHVAKLAAHGPTFAKFVTTIVSSIDDRLDAMSFEEMQSLGKIEQGDTPCEFLRHPLVLTAEEWKVFQEIDRHGIMPLPLIVAFGNLLAEKVFAEKQACYLSQTDPAARLDARRSHLELSQLCVELIAAVTNPLELRKYAGQQKNLSFEFVAAVNPDRTKFGSIIQLYDDMTDLIKDLWVEKRLGAAGPNCLIADIANGQGLDDCVEFSGRPEIKNLKPLETVRTETLPDIARDCWRAMVGEAVEIAAGIRNKSAREGLTQIMQGLPGPQIPRSNNIA